MPKSETRKKHNSSKPGRKVENLGNFPVTAAMVQCLKHDMTTRLMRLRMGGGDGKDLATLVVYFGQAWLLAGAMEEAETLRAQFEIGVNDLCEAITHAPETAIENQFDALLDLIEQTTKIFSLSTRGEYQRACDKLKAPDAVAFVNDFFDVATQAELLEIL